MIESDGAITAFRIDHRLAVDARRLLLNRVSPPLGRQQRTHTACQSGITMSLPSEDSYGRSDARIESALL
jgi:hypothetical protein